MKTAGFFILLLILVLTMTSCINLFDEDNEYIAVYIQNNTSEALVIYGGLYFVVAVPAAVIQSGNQQSVMVLKGEIVRAVGQTTGKEYASKTFYWNSNWTIY